MTTAQLWGASERREFDFDSVNGCRLHAPRITSSSTQFSPNSNGIYIIIRDKSVSILYSTRKCHVYGEACGCQRREAANSNDFFFHCVIHENVIWINKKNTDTHTNLSEAIWIQLIALVWCANVFDRRTYSCVLASSSIRMRAWLPRAHDVDEPYIFHSL